MSKPLTSKARIDFRNSIKEAIAKKEAQRQQQKTKQAKQPPSLLQELEYALTVILVELASSDNNFDQGEYHTICLSLQRVFDTDRMKAKEYINRASISLAQVRGTTSYVHQLRDNLDRKKREIIIEVIEELISSDGELDPFEMYHRNRIKHILLPEDRDSEDDY